MESLTKDTLSTVCTYLHGKDMFDITSLLTFDPLFWKDRVKLITGLSLLGNNPPTNESLTYWKSIAITPDTDNFNEKLIEH